MNDTDPASAPLVRAAQYVRMSSDHQRFSIEAQQAVIAEYARVHGYKIVQTYADSGKSGLSLRGREALQQLLSDVLSPDRKFEALLVPDVSRWGRFQDPDQAAHYEFICRQAGLQVRYCAEPFDNDASLITTLIKQVKRAMAAEYSRDLSAKVSRAHLQHARLGFYQGGSLPYGFRRQVVDEHGTSRRLLEPGTQKALRLERVRIVPGPTAELAVIRTLFDLYVEQGRSRADIVRYLRKKEILGNMGRPWTSPMLRNVMASELCVGRYVYNRTTQKLQSRGRKNVEASWVRATIFPPIIPEETFSRAQQCCVTCEAQQPRVTRRAKQLSNQTLLDRLRALLLAKGRLSQSIVDRTLQMPAATTYARRFGSFRDALKQIGYVGPMCISGKDRAWSAEDLKTSLRRLYDEHGYLSKQVVATDPSLPSYASIRRKVGTLATVYEFIDAPQKSRTQILEEARLRCAAKIRGRPGTQGPRKDWNETVLIKRMKNLLARTGYLSGPLIDANPDLPSATTVRSRFGSLFRAYRAAGWSVDKSTLARLRRARMRRVQLSASG
jgi:DNA invertase Pin-like site-specific DNA recombinase